MDGWLSKDIEYLTEIQEKYCHETGCDKCYFNSPRGCLGDVVTNIGVSYRHLDHIFEVFNNQIKEHF